MTNKTGAPFALNFGYEKKLDARFVPNGLCAISPLYGRFVRAEGEYHEPVCRGPLLGLLTMHGESFTQNLISEQRAQGQPYVYLLEMLYTLDSWLPLASGNDPRISPWRQIAPEVIADLQSGRAVMVITHFKKGQDDLIAHQLFAKLHRRLDALGVPASQVVFIGHNPGLEDLYGQFLHASPDVSPFRTVFSIPYFEWGWEWYYRNFKNQDETYNSALAESELETPKRYRFLCFNRFPHAHRLVNALWLHRHGFLPKVLMSFPRRDQNFQYSLNPLHADSVPSVFHDPEILDLLKDVDRFEAQNLPLLVDHQDLWALHIAWCTRAPFRDSYFSLLTERLFDNPNGHQLLTSKAYKAICNMHPFLMIGPHGSLAALRDQGYRTFAPWIDESYDTEPDPSLRIKMVWREVARLCELPEREMQKLYRNVFPIAQANFANYHSRASARPVKAFARELRACVHEALTVSRPSRDLDTI